MDLSLLSPVQRQKLVTTLFAHLDFFQTDARLCDWGRLAAFQADPKLPAQRLLSAWLDRLAVLNRVGFGWVGSSARYSLVDASESGQALKAYGDAPAIVPHDWCHADQTDLVFVSPRVGPYAVDFVVGRYEVDFIGPGHDGVTRKQQPVAVRCGEPDGAPATGEDAEEKARVARLEDEAIRAYGFRLIRFTGEEVEADAARCARTLDEQFVPTWCHKGDGKSDHPYDLIMDEVLGRSL